MHDLKFFLPFSQTLPTYCSQLSCVALKENCIILEVLQVAAGSSFFVLHIQQCLFFYFLAKQIFLHVVDLDHLTWAIAKHSL